MACAPLGPRCARGGGRRPLGASQRGFVEELGARPEHGGSTAEVAEYLLDTCVVLETEIKALLTPSRTLPPERLATAIGRFRDLVDECDLSDFDGEWRVEGFKKRLEEGLFEFWGIIVALAHSVQQMGQAPTTWRMPRRSCIGIAGMV